MMQRLRPPPPAHRVLAARRRLPHRGAARQARRAEDAGGGGHRARQHVLVGRSSTTTARKHGRQADPRVRGLRRARRPPRRRAARPGETPNHLVLLAETNEGYHNLIKLVSAGYTEGFYYKPRIDKELLAQHAERADRPEQLPEGRGGRRASAPTRQQRARRGGGRVSRHPRRRTTSSSRCSTRASTSSGSSTAACCRSPRDLGLPLVVHERRALPAATTTTSRTTCCSASAPARRVNDAEAAALPRRPVLPEDAPRRWRQVFGDFPRRSPTPLRIAERCNVDLDSKDELTCRTSTCRAGFTLDELLRARRRARGSTQRLPRLQRAGRAAALLQHTLDEYERAPRLRDRR